MFRIDRGVRINVHIKLRGRDQDRVNFLFGFGLLTILGKFLSFVWFDQHPNYTCKLGQYIEWSYCFWIVLLLNLLKGAIYKFS